MQTAHYGTLVIRPRSMQFAIDELPLLLLCLAGYGCAGIENLIGSGMLLRVSVLCAFIYCTDSSTCAVPNTLSAANR